MTDSTTHPAYRSPGGPLRSPLRSTPHPPSHAHAGPASPLPAYSAPLAMNGLPHAHQNTEPQPQSDIWAYRKDRVTWACTRWWVWAMIAALILVIAATMYALKPK